MISKEQLLALYQEAKNDNVSLGKEGAVEEMWERLGVDPEAVSEIMNLVVGDMLYNLVHHEEQIPTAIATAWLIGLEFGLKLNATQSA